MELLNFNTSGDVHISLLILLFFYLVGLLGAHTKK